MFTIQTMHPDCPDCQARAQVAEAVARCTGSIGGTSKLTEGGVILHAAQVRREVA